jgi:hypothetical protein
VSKGVPSDTLGDEGWSSGDDQAAKPGLALILVVSLLSSAIGATIFNATPMGALISWWSCGLLGVLVGAALVYAASSRSARICNATDDA